VEVADADRIDPDPAAQSVTRPRSQCRSRKHDCDPHSGPRPQEYEEGGMKTTEKQREYGSRADSHPRSIGAAQPVAGGVVAELRNRAIRPPPTTVSPR
jgi:hypothetical protein